MRFFFSTSTEYALLRMSMFLVGKFAITVTFCVTYMLTAEIFPTQMRATLISLCSMIGRIGSILAPQMTLVVSKIYSITAINRNGTNWWTGRDPIRSNQGYCRLPLRPMNFCSISNTVGNGDKLLNIALRLFTSN